MMSKTTNKFSPEVRERAVRLVLDHKQEDSSRWAAIESIAGKIGCAPQTLLEWVKKTETNTGKRPGVTVEMAEKMKALLWTIIAPRFTVRKLRQANKILRKASAYFARLSAIASNRLPRNGTELGHPLRK